MVVAGRCNDVFTRMLIEIIYSKNIVVYKFVCLVSTSV